MPLDVALKAPETLVARSELVAMGRFVCPSSHELFRDSGPCTHHTIVFPRTATAIRRDDDARFVGDPTTVVFYNQHQRYTRSKVSEVDECDWFVVADEVLFDALSRFDPSAGERRDRPFVVPFVAADAAIYAAQRRMFDRAAGGYPVDPLAFDEEAIGILNAVLECAHAPSVAATHGGRGRAVAARLEAVKRRIAADVAASLTLRQLAASAGCSPFELCRSFRSASGMTISEYRSSLRMRLALAMLRDRRKDLAEIALDLGFSSHSHFSARFRAHFGMTPSTWRAVSR